MAASMPRACAIVPLLVLAESLRFNSRSLPGLVRAKIPVSFSSFSSVIPRVSLLWDANDNESEGSESSEETDGSEADLPPMTGMWKDVLKAALENDACEQLKKWADGYAFELQTRTGMNVVGGVAGVVGVASAGVEAAQVGSKAFQQGMNTAGNIANAWDVVDPLKETGEALHSVIWEAEKEFNDIREAHRTDGDKTWTTIKRLHMGASLVVLGGVVTVGTSGAGLPAYVAAAGAGTAAFGGGAAVYNQSMVENDREEFHNFLECFEFHCARTRNVRLDLQPLREATVRLESDGESLMILPIPNQDIPSNPQDRLVYAPTSYGRLYRVQLVSSEAYVAGSWVTFTVQDKTFTTRAPRATQVPFTWTVTVVA